MQATQPGCAVHWLIAHPRQRPRAGPGSRALVLACSAHRARSLTVWYRLDSASSSSSLRVMGSPAAGGGKQVSTPGRGGGWGGGTQCWPHAGCRRASKSRPRRTSAGAACIVQQCGRALTHAGQQLDGLHGLQRANGAGHRAHHACIRAARAALGAGRLGEQAAVAGTVLGMAGGRQGLCGGGGDDESENGGMIGLGGGGSACSASASVVDRPECQRTSPWQ